MGEGGSRELSVLEASAVFKELILENLGYILSAPNFGLGGSILREKDPIISGKKTKRY